MAVSFTLAQDTQQTLKKILLKLFDLFLKLGGHFKKQNVETVNISFDDKPVIKTNLNSYTFDKTVIACGAFSKKINRSGK